LPLIPIPHCRQRWVRIIAGAKQIASSLGKSRADRARIALFDLPNIQKEIDMNQNIKNFVIRTLVIAGLTAGAMSSADAAVWFRTRVVVAPVVAAPVVVAPVVAAPVVAAPIVAAPVVATPVVAPVVVVPVCSVVSVPVVNAITGVTYLVPRRVCR
jgi:hypothetical protein